MRIVVAPDSFKDCLSASVVAAILSDEISSQRPDIHVTECPLSDGGEGFTEIVTSAFSGDFIPVVVTGPLGEQIESGYGRVGNTAILDAASCCGLSLVPPERRNPLLTTSRGMGEMIVEAFAGGCSEFIVGLGGSATCDGGEGMMSVEGIRDLENKISIELLCDVRNPFLGEKGAAVVFGPQKGASPEDVLLLEKRMEKRARTILSDTGIDVSFLPRTGAAGGLAGALYAYFDAEIHSGIESVLEYLDFGSIAGGADWILTGEGRSDMQTLSGKVPMGVLLNAGRSRVALLSGTISDRDALSRAGFSLMLNVTPPGVSREDALRPDVAEANLRRAAREFLREMRKLSEQ